MPTKWKNTKKTENEGVLYVAKVINEANSIFNKVDGSNDVGIDGYIEFVEKESLTGLCVAIQIKSGETYQNHNRSCAIIRADKEHFQYWKAHSLPVAGIVFIPSENTAYWVDITEYLERKEKVIENGPYTIRIPKENTFTDLTFPEFYRKFLSYKALFNKEWNFGRALKAMADFHSRNERVDAIKSLFYFHRNQKESWYYLVQQFRVEEDLSIQRLLIQNLKHLISHGDIFWHKDNIMDEEVRVHGKALIKKYFGLSEIHKLLQHTDENGISRGSFGQNIYPMIDLITNKIELLKKIILNCGTGEQERFWAAIILIDDFQHFDIERAVNFAQSMITNFPSSENIERFEFIKEALVENGRVDFTG